MKCNCEKKGLAHWWKYLRFRLWWRAFWTRMVFQEAIVDGQRVWLRLDWPYVSIHKQYPGPSMSRDEHEHWFRKSVGGSMVYKKPLTWECHVCGEERPDAQISVLSKPLVIEGRECGTLNIRYCNDKAECIEGVKHKDFWR